MSIIDNLNAFQKEAVINTNGPVLVIAGAGSGKTRALTHRIAYLIKEKGVNPWNILAVTFTNKAASEMKQRVAELLNINVDLAKYESPDMPTMGTFHSICVRILRKNIHLMGQENSFVIYDAADQLALVKMIMKELMIDDRKFNPRAILSHISGAKNQMMNYMEYKKFANNIFTDNTALVYEHYQKALDKANALDFDDILFKTVVLFSQEKEILQKYQEQFKYINVDEYQDTNHAQYKLVTMLADKYKNICVVGDDWQSIYSWRGADIQNILDFNKDYPEAKIVKLEQNYRSTQTILDAADCVIRKNKNRTDKKLWTDNNKGDVIQIIRAEDERHEGETIAREIERISMARLNEVTYKDFVVLYRTNAQSRVLEEIFMRYGIPYKIVGGVRFYERKEIKDVLAYLRLIHNPSDTVSLLRILNVPSRKIGDKTVQVVQNFAKILGISLMEAINRAEEINELPPAKREVLLKFANLMKELRQANIEFAAAGVIKHILITAKYKEFLLDGSPEGEVRFENVQELISVASKYDKLEPGISLATFLEEVALIADIDQLNDGDSAITMMTLHSAKGLEYPFVFICGLEEGVFPHSRSMLEPAELEEERRLMYVGVTRAKELLYLMCARRRLLYGDSRSNAPSQFLADLPDELVEKVGFEMASRQSAGIGPIRPVPVEEDTIGNAIDDKDELKTEEFSDGDNIIHKKFGQGVVLNVTGGIITIAFKDPRVGVKKLAISVAPLEKI